MPTKEIYIKETPQGPQSKFTPTTVNTRSLSQNAAPLVVKVNLPVVMSDDQFFCLVTPLTEINGKFALLCVLHGGCVICAVGDGGRMFPIPFGINRWICKKSIARRNCH